MAQVFKKYNATDMGKQLKRGGVFIEGFCRFSRKITIDLVINLVGFLALGDLVIKDFVLILFVQLQLQDGKRGNIVTYLF